MVWTNVEHSTDGVRLALSEQHGPDVDLVLPPPAAEELGRALFLGGSASYVNALTVDGDPIVVSASAGEVQIESKGGSPMVFVLAEEAVKLGEEILARPVRYDTQCPVCGRRSQSTTTLAPSSQAAEERAQHEEWTCPFCTTKVAAATLVLGADDVWRVNS